MTKNIESTPLELPELMHFIPISRQDLIKDLSSLATEIDSSGQLSNVFFYIRSIYGFEFHQIADQLKLEYEDIDSDLIHSNNNDKSSNSNFLDRFESLLLRANYKQLSRSDLELALTQSSLFKIQLDVDFDDFSDLLVFVRGVKLKHEVLKTFYGLRSQSVELDKTALIALFAGLAAFAAYLWKQFSRFKNRKLSFMQSLTKNLYFKNLDNNLGVVHRLIDEAGEEECKEAILAYTFLLKNGSPVLLHQLDEQIEKWFEQHYQVAINFEVDDAIQKLLKPGLVKQHDQSFAAVNLQEGRALLLNNWRTLMPNSEATG
jgi:hypothetical protein